MAITVSMLHSLAPKPLSTADTLLSETVFLLTQPHTEIKVHKPKKEGFCLPSFPLLTASKSLAYRRAHMFISTNITLVSNPVINCSLYTWCRDDYGKGLAKSLSAKNSKLETNVGMDSPRCPKGLLLFKNLA